MNLKKYNILTAETIYGLSSIIIECYHHLEHMHHWKMKVCIFRVSRYKYSSIWNACNHRVFISFLNWIIYYVGLFVRDGLRCKEDHNTSSKQRSPSSYLYIISLFVLDCHMKDEFSGVVDCYSTPIWLS